MGCSGGSQGAVREPSEPSDDQTDRAATDRAAVPGGGGARKKQALAGGEWWWLAVVGGSMGGRLSTDASCSLQQGTKVQGLAGGSCSERPLAAALVVVGRRSIRPIACQQRGLRVLGVSR